MSAGMRDLIVVYLVADAVSLIQATIQPQAWRSPARAAHYRPRGKRYEGHGRLQQLLSARADHPQLIADCDGDAPRAVADLRELADAVDAHAAEMAREVKWLGKALLPISKFSHISY